MPPHLYILAFCRLVLITIVTCFLAPLAAIFKIISMHQIAFYICFLWHWGICKIANIRVNVRGKIHDNKGGECTILLANHISYLDINILGSVFFARFIAKSDVEKWPVIGRLAKLQDTIFIERKMQTIKQQSEKLKCELQKGKNFILFPEGTSSDGTHILPFKSSLMQVPLDMAHSMPVYIQPVSLSYTALNSLPISRGMRPFFGWYGDMDLLPHLWIFLGLGRLKIDIIMGDAIAISPNDNRKKLSLWAERTVRQNLQKHRKKH